MLATDKDWAKGYAKQALSDLQVREQLAIAGMHKCHRLHFLQMAAEKTCKAHLTHKDGHDNVRHIHAYVAKNLPIIARNYYSNLNQPSEIAQWEISEIRRLAHEIEVLAPACDDDNTRKDNSEYPWLAACGQVTIPCEYSFPNIDDESRSIVRLIRLIRTAAEAFAS